MIYIITTGGSYEDKKYVFVLVPEKYRREEWRKSIERLLVTDFYEMGYEPKIIGTAPHTDWREGSELRAVADYILPSLFVEYDEAMQSGVEYLGPMQVPKYDREGSSVRTVWARAKQNSTRIPSELLRLLVADWKAINNEHNLAYLPVLEVMLEKMR